MYHIMKLFSTIFDFFNLAPKGHTLRQTILIEIELLFIMFFMFNPIYQQKFVNDLNLSTLNCCSKYISDLLH